MANVELKGMFNKHTLIKNSDSNVSSADNHMVYSQIIRGKQDSELFSYLLNMNQQRLNDFKSMMAYNETNEASLINEAQYLNEIVDKENTVSLTQNYFKLKEKLDNVLEHRHSSRVFAGTLMSEKTFSTIMHYAFGITNRKIFYDETETTTRYYSSGGGLYPVNVYVYCNNVEGIKQGVYLYQPLSHSLLFINEEINKIDSLEFFNGENIDVLNSNFSLFFGYRISSTYLKYGELSLLNTLVETGIMSHNFDLVVTSLGYTSCPIAGYKKTYIEDLLDFDHVDEHILFSNVCGKE